LSLIAMALDLCVPPLALLVLLWLVTGLLSALLLACGGPAGPLVVSGVSGLLLLAAIVLGWATFGRRVIGLAQLLTAPGYALRKLPYYITWLTRRQVAWVRTDRSNSGHGQPAVSTSSPAASDDPPAAAADSGPMPIIDDHEPCPSPSLSGEDSRGP
jgi:hypothetical protein